MTHKRTVLFLLLLLTSFITANAYSNIKKEAAGFYISKIIKLKKINIQKCAAYETGNYTILVDQKQILADLKKQIPDSAYANLKHTGSDTLDLNKIELQSQRVLLEAIIRQIENGDAIIIHIQSRVRLYKIKRRKYNRTINQTRRRGGIEYIDPKNKSVILDLGLWIS